MIEFLMTAIDGWTDDQVNLLRVLHATGNSASIMAKELGRTRNAVISKCHRMGLATRKPTITKYKTGIAKTRRTQPRRRADVALRVATTHAVSLPVDEPFEMLQPRTLMELQTGECHYPVGNPFAVGFFYCGNAANGSYCAHHHRLTHGRSPSGQRMALGAGRTGVWT